MALDRLLASLAPVAPPLPELVLQASAVAETVALGYNGRHVGHDGDEDDDDDDDDDDVDEDEIDIPSDFEGDPDDYVEEQLALRRLHKRRKLAHDPAAGSAAMGSAGVAVSSFSVTPAGTASVPAESEDTLSDEDPQARPFATPGSPAATRPDGDRCWAGLPRRAAHTVLLMLDYADLFRLRLVSRRLHAELESDAFWARRFRQDFPLRWEDLERSWGGRSRPPGDESARWGVRQLLFWHLNQLVGQSYGDDALRIAAMHRYWCSVLQERSRRFGSRIQLRPTASTTAGAQARPSRRFSSAPASKTKVTVDLM